MRAPLSAVLAGAGTAGAVGSFNIIDFDLARAIVAAGERAGRPVIVGVAARHWAAIDAANLSPSVVRLIERSSIPVALHLDHAKPSDMGIVRAALDLGFSSVMIDGSSLPFDRNVEATAGVVELARGFGVGVEGELGSVLGEEGVAEQKTRDAGDDGELTDPRSAPAFVARTRIEALAVAVGTAHGLYVKPPAIRFDLIREIAAAVAVPLVLHGATGIADDDIRETIRCGIRKINYFSGFLVAATEVIGRHARLPGFDVLAYKAALLEAWIRTARTQIDLYASA